MAQPTPYAYSSRSLAQAWSWSYPVGPTTAHRGNTRDVTSAQLWPQLPGGRPEGNQVEGTPRAPPPLITPPRYEEEKGVEAGVGGGRTGQAGRGSSVSVAIYSNCSRNSQPSDHSYVICSNLFAVRVQYLYTATSYWVDLRQAESPTWVPAIFDDLNPNNLRWFESQQSPMTWIPIISDEMYSSGTIVKEGRGCCLLSSCIVVPLCRLWGAIWFQWQSGHNTKTDKILQKSCIDLNAERPSTCEESSHQKPTWSIWQTASVLESTA